MSFDDGHAKAFAETREKKNICSSIEVGEVGLRHRVDSLGLMFDSGVDDRAGKAKPLNFPGKVDGTNRIGVEIELCIRTRLENFGEGFESTNEIFAIWCGIVPDIVGIQRVVGAEHENGGGWVGPA